MNRREFLRTAGGATAVAGAAGTAAAQSGGNESSGGNSGGGSAPTPDFGGYLDGVSNFEGNVVDLRGQETATVEVGVDGNQGTNAYGPPAIHVDPGTTVVWQWTGQGAHNVVNEAGNWESGPAVGGASTTYERTFESSGIHKYYCTPHKPFGMKGAVVVGGDYPTVATGPGGRTPVDPHHLGAPFRPHFVGIATALAVFVTLVFAFFTLKYGESAHTSGGND